MSRTFLPRHEYARAGIYISHRWLYLDLTLDQWLGRPSHYALFLLDRRDLVCIPAESSTFGIPVNRTARAPKLNLFDHQALRHQLQCGIRPALLVSGIAGVFSGMLAQDCAGLAFNPTKMDYWSARGCAQTRYLEALGRHTGDPALAKWRSSNEYGIEANR